MNRITLLCLLCLGLQAAVQVTITDGQPGVLELPHLGVAFSYPPGWQLGQQDESVHVLYKKKFAQVSIRTFKLPDEGMPLKTFVERVSQTMTPPYTLKKDHGLQTVGSTEFHVHDLIKKGAGRANWTAWFHITEKNYGLWIICEYGGTSSHEQVLQVIGSMRKPGEADPLAIEAPIPEPTETETTPTTPEHETPTTDKPTAIVVTPKPEKPQPEPEAKPEIKPEQTQAQPSGPKNPDGSYRVFGTHSDEGSFKGTIFRSNLRDRSALPAFIAFWPAIPDPQPILTATDERGRYTVNLPKGTYSAEVYKANGQVWPLLKGADEIKSRGKSGLHHFKINND